MKRVLHIYLADGKGDRTFYCLSCLRRTTAAYWRSIVSCCVRSSMP